MKIDYARILRMMRPSEEQAGGGGRTAGRQAVSVAIIAAIAVGVGVANASRGVKNPPNLI